MTKRSCCWRVPPDHPQRKAQWGKLTDDLRQLARHGEQLAGKLQEQYALEREEAERQVQEFGKRITWH